jgi:uncharacterized protein YbjT (DUF2867 family)
MKIALVGATGLVGSYVPARLAQHELLVLSRRPTGDLVAPAADWPRLLDGEEVDVAISTLGTTWRKAGSWPAFEAVDRTAVIDFARAAKESGARQMISVSSVGADAGARDAYLALKAQVEQDLASLGFARLDLLRPGLLRGPRGGDRRLGERLGIAASPLVNLIMRGRLDRFAAIDAKDVAAAIAALAGNPETGTHFHHNREIRGLARA